MLPMRKLKYPVIKVPGKNERLTPAILTEIDNGTTLGDLSRKLDVSVGMLSMVFNGKRQPSLALAKGLALALGTTVDRLAYYLNRVRKVKPGNAK
jgi:transcriptional regulator with XRE-family HTH domain